MSNTTILNYIIPKAFRKWVITKRKKPILLLGRESVGKKTTIKNLAKEYFESTIWIDYSTHKNSLEGLTDPIEIIKKIELLSGCKVDRENTMIVFYNTENAKEPFSFLNYFTDLYRKYAIVFISSNLSLLDKISEQNNVQIEVLSPINFKTFLNNTSQIFSSAFNYFINKSEIVMPMKVNNLNGILERFCLYCYLGSYPSVINTYLKNKDFTMVETTKESIISDIRMSMIQSNNGIEGLKFNSIYSSIPKQFKTGYKRFRYNLINPNARERQYMDTINNISNQNYLHKIKADNGMFKMLPVDTGLLISSLDADIKKMILEKVIPHPILETYVVNALKSIEGSSLKYVATSTKNIQPYLWDYGGKLYSIFIGDNYRNNLIKNLTQREGAEMAIKFGVKNISLHDSILTLPVFYADYTQSFISKAALDGLRESTFTDRSYLY